MLTAITEKYHQFSHRHPNLTALAWIGLAGLAAFGIMITQVGFYGDDWCYLWLLFKGAGIELYFRSSRSVLAPIFTTLAALLGDQPLAWQIYSLCIRMLCAFLFWKVLSKIWPNLQKYALLTAILWLVYPGYRLAYVSMNMSIFFVVLSCYFLSIYLQLLSINNARFRWVLILSSLVLANINITFTEYYFFAELVRPVFLCLFLINQDLSWKESIKKVALAWIPFFILFFGAVIWRAFFQSKINGFYTLKLLDDFKANPFPTILNQIVQIARDCWTTLIVAWGNGIFPAQWLNAQHFKWYYYLIPLIILCVFLYLGQYLLREKPTAKQPTHIYLPAFQWIALGLLWIVLCGWPVWLAKLRIGTDFASTRFALPMIPGAVIATVGVLLLLQKVPKIQLAAISILLASSILFQNLIGNALRMDWMKQKEIYTQLSWRFPSIPPGTLFVFNRSSSTEGEENSFAAAINWFFSSRPKDINLDYYTYYIPERFEYDTQGVFEGTPKTRGHLIGRFTSRQEQIIAIEIDPRNCIRVLYPGLDERDGHLTELLQTASQYSTTPNNLTTPGVATNQELQHMFGNPLDHDWCWAYQRADYLRQLGDWQTISKLADEINPDEYRKDWQKLNVFIESYAHTSQTAKAADLTRALNQFPPSDKNFYCLTTKNWLDELSPADEFLQEINLGRKQLKCK